MADHHLTTERRALVNGRAWYWLCSCGESGQAKKNQEFYAKRDGMRHAETKIREEAIAEVKADPDIECLDCGYLCICGSFFKE